MSRDRFDWHTEGNDDVVLRCYGSIAVHENPDGDVVIRQEANAFEDDDAFVVVPVQDAELVAQAIIDKAKEIKAGWAADRQQQQPQQQQQQEKPRLLTAPKPVMNGELQLEQGTKVTRARNGAQHD